MREGELNLKEWKCRRTTRREPLGGEMERLKVRTQRREGEEAREGEDLRRRRCWRGRGEIEMRWTALGLGRKGEWPGPKGIQGFRLKRGCDRAAQTPVEAVPGY